MHVRDLIIDLNNSGVELWAKAGKLGYRGPKEVLTPSKLALLKQFKTEIIAYLDQGKAEKHYYPMSHGQKALWYINKIMPDSAAYTIGTATKIRSVLDIEALKRAWQWIVSRYETLRTTFKMHNEVPVQVIHDYQEINFFVVDASSWKEEDISREVGREHTKPFDLEKGPNYRFVLFRLSEYDYITLISIHHICFDGWSNHLLMPELLIRYYSEISGEAFTLPSPPHTYSDYVTWQNRMLASERGQRLFEFWQQKLSGELTQLDLRPDKPRPPVQTANGRTLKFQLPEALSRQLKALAKNEGVTGYMLFLAAFQVLLHRYTAQEDIIIGSPANGRTNVDFSQTVGYFVNLVVLRGDLSGNPTFRQFLKQIRRVALEAIEYQDYPFALLVEKLKIKHDAQRSAIFQVLFNYMKKQEVDATDQLLTRLNPDKLMTPEGLSLEKYAIPEEEGQFELTLAMWEEEQTTVGRFVYNTDLYEETTILRLLAHFKNLLKGIVARPDQRLLEIPLLSDEEYRQIVHLWNETGKVFDRQGCVHQLFEAQVSRSPDKIAVVAEFEQITYAELNAKANQLSGYLRSMGVGPESLVGVSLERSIDMVVAVLGILKAGGAYVPLDPQYPSERLAFMRSDADIKVLITHKHLDKTLDGGDGHIFNMDTQWSQAAAFSTSNPVTEVLTENLAYVIYTSGSTGVPKGVMIQHNTLVNFVNAAQQLYSIKASDRVLQFASLNFDAAVEEIFPSLISGATLVLRTEEMIGSINVFIEKCRQYQLTLLDLPTAFWHQLTAEMNTNIGFLPESVRLVIIGGERAHPEQVRLWKQAVGSKPKLVNTYGPTETTVVVTSWEMDDALPDAGSPAEVPIGRPLPNIQTYILDKEKGVVPVGVGGELYIGGECLARGYLNNPALTAERFIRNPFSDHPDSRLYRTGDLVRYLPGGNIEFVGRNDEQVKVRGFRVELGEIEKKVAALPDVLDAAVVAPPDNANVRRLVAFVVPREKVKLNLSDLKRQLKTRLPDYMIPGNFVQLAEMPLLPNGKVNRKALQVPKNFTMADREDWVGARDPVEKQLVEIWESILNINPVGIKDDFFNLGGHSLLVIKLMDQIQQTFGEKIPLTVFVKDATIENLANHIRKPVSVNESSVLVPLQTAGQRPPFFCVHPRSGVASCFLELAMALGHEQPFYGFQAPGLHGETQTPETIKELAQCYIRALKTLQPRGPYFIGGYSLGCSIAFEMAQQLRQAEQKTDLLVLIDSSPKFTNIEKYFGNLEDLKARQGLAFADLISNTYGGRKIPVTADMLREINPGEHAAYIIQAARNAKVIPANIDDQSLMKMLNVAIALTAALLDYEIQKYPGPVVHFNASERIRTNDDPSFGWAAFSTEKVETYEIPGNHYQILDKPSVVQFAEKLGELIKRAHNNFSM